MTTDHDKRPRLSVILPVRNEASHVARVLGELLDQSLDAEAYELLVVDGMSDDGTRDVVGAIMAEHPGVRLLDNPGRWSGRARNVGVEAARAPYVLFVDGHCSIPSRTLLEDVLGAFETEDVRCISRPQPLQAEPGHPFQEAVILARRSPLGHHAGSEIFRHGRHRCSPLSAGCGYARDLYLELGGVDTSFDAAEDLEFNLRVEQSGHDALHDDAFTVGYMARDSWRGLMRQIYRYGHGRARMARKHPSRLLSLSWLPALLVLALLALPVAALASPLAGKLWLLAAGAYGIAVAVGAVWASRSRPSAFGDVLAALVAIHLGGGLGYLMGILGGPCGNTLPDDDREPSQPIL